MAYILNIETATKNCSVSLSHNGTIQVLKEYADQGFSHAEKLHVFMEEALREAQITWADLAAIAVSKGPGSYTGLRIGVSAAKGLCYALHIPLIALDTLEILARQIKIPEGLIVPLLDARRMEVYNAVFDTNYKNVKKTEAQIIDEDSFSGQTEKLYFLGDGAEKIKSILKHKNVIFMDNHVFPSANQMAGMSYQAYTSQSFVDLAYFEPFYLKDFLVQSPKK